MDTKEVVAELIFTILCCKYYENTCDYCCAFSEGVLQKSLLS